MELPVDVGLSTNFVVARKMRDSGASAFRSMFSVLIPSGGQRVICGYDHYARQDVLRGHALVQSSFSYRILVVDDEPLIRQTGKALFELQGYEVITAGDGFEALLALKRSLPDIIISDLSMPNMSGFEFLSVVRRRFPTIPVIVISGEFTELSRPESVLTDAYFSKGAYTPDALFKRVIELIQELPSRPRVGRPDRAAVWVKNDRGIVAVTCTDCLRTFPVADTIVGVNTVGCEFCPCIIRFEVIGGTDAESRHKLPRST